MVRKKIKRIILTSVSVIVFFSCKNVTVEVSKDTNSGEPVYDSALAKRLNADDYGMGKYVMAFLKRGPNRSDDPAIRDSLQREHLKNIGRLAEEGKLLLAGPFMDDGDLRGIYIFDVESIKEAKKLTETDPAIQSGSLVMELYPWYGSAAVREINSIHSRIQKQGVVE